MTASGTEGNLVAGSLDRIHLRSGRTGREELERIDRRLRDFVTERPLTAVLLALSAGYVVGRIISRI
jgi:hypothetical protein